VQLGIQRLLDCILRSKGQRSRSQRNFPANSRTQAYWSTVCYRRPVTVSHKDPKLAVSYCPTSPLSVLARNHHPYRYSDEWSSGGKNANCFWSKRNIVTMGNAINADAYESNLSYLIFISNLFESQTLII